MVVTFSFLYTFLGAALIVAGVVCRGVLVVAMNHSEFDRFSYLATWLLVSPILLTGLFILWVGVTSTL